MRGWPAVWLVTGNPESNDRLILAHGAGAPMDGAFMNNVAEGLAERGVCVIRFEFAYMAARRTSGGRKGPGRAEALRGEYLEVIRRAGPPDRIAIGGKSMGGRVASMVADGAGVRALVCLGYPFHPLGQKGRLRVAHLESLKTPALILQGSRDAFGAREEVKTYRLSPAIRVVYLEQGDHSFKPPRDAPRTEAQLLQQAVEETAAFLRRLWGHR